MKFLDVRTDFFFKKVFGCSDSKVRLISFLNSMIDLMITIKLLIYRL